MFPGQGDQFGAPPGADGGNFGGPPPADAMFEAFFNDGLDELAATETSVEQRENDVFAAGLHFFKNMRAM